FERYGFWIVANVDGNSGNEGADLAIPLDSVNEISKRFANALNGYFIGKRLAFSIVENYVKNTWAKYGINGLCFIAFFSSFNSRLGKAVRKAESTKAYDYRPVNGNDEASTFQLNTNKVTSDPLPDRIGKKEQELNLFSLKNSFDALSKEDNMFVEKDLSIEPMDEVVDDARKKVEAPPKKTPKKTVFGRVESELP
ncbi:hypothetical protein Tco_1017247, partial [Tanacetum coccineum]